MRNLGFTILNWAITWHRPGIIKMILKFPEGEQLLFARTQDQGTPAHGIVFETHEVQKVFLSHPLRRTFLTLKDERGDTPLHVATARPQSLGFFLDAIENDPEILSIKNNKGNSVLGEAIHTGNARAIAVFAKHGVSLDSAIIEGELASPIEFLLKEVSKKKLNVIERSLQKDRENLLEMLANDRFNSTTTKWEEP